MVGCKHYIMLGSHFIHASSLKVKYIKYIFILLGEMEYNDFGQYCIEGKYSFQNYLEQQVWLFLHECVFTVYRIKIASLTDRRVHLMREIIVGMRVIKMYCWEKPFAKLINKLRR